MYVLILRELVLGVFAWVLGRRPGLGGRGSAAARIRSC